ncbi:MAG TPA: hypothetical protein HPP81_02150 [Deltaproteobacteria bacterium]|jgi:predicted RNA-binding Zn-ribbon protein involved in translation (DUF1610 family)|nr:hypothetical protein [Deltaproteobacteria bacterium]
MSNVSGQKITPEGGDWICVRCKRPLEPGTVSIAYQKSSFPVELFRCPDCGQVYISEELAIGKMAEIEMLLEDK